MCKLYNDLQLKIVENQDSYRNKDDFRFFLKQKVLIRGIFTLECETSSIIPLFEFDVRILLMCPGQYLFNQCSYPVW